MSRPRRPNSAQRQEKAPASAGWHLPRAAQTPPRPSNRQRGFLAAAALAFASWIVLLVVLAFSR